MLALKTILKIFYIHKLMNENQNETENKMKMQRNDIIEKKKCYLQ